MLGPVLVVDPPPGSALRLLVVSVLVTFQWACSTAVRLTATGSPDPSVNGDYRSFRDQLPRSDFFSGGAHQQRSPSDSSGVAPR